MSNQWQCEIAITPQAKQSVRFIKNGRAYPDRGKAQYVNALRLYVMAHPPTAILQGPLSLSADFIWPYPKSWGKKKRMGIHAKATRPDIDNLVKPLKDAMTGVVFQDDAQVVRYERIGKYYGPQAAIHITVWELQKGGE